MTSMPFGQYKGEDLGDIDLGYLIWVLEKAYNVSPRLRAAIKEEIASRLELHSSPAPDDSTDKLREVIAQWYRKQCLKHHPDRSGDESVMASLNDLHDSLQEALNEQLEEATA